MTLMETPRSPVSHVAGMFTPWTGPFPVVTPQSVTPTLRPQLAGAATYLRGDRALPQLIRFAMVGGSSNVAYVLLFFAMYGVGPLVANVAGSVVSTIIANEFHRQLTFHATDRVSWFTAQWEGGGIALIGLAITTACLAGLDFWAPGLGDGAQAAFVLGITAAVGLMRFLALRGLFRLPVT